MVTKKVLVVAVLVIFSLTVTVLLTMPTRSNPALGDYDPWVDLNEDGSVDILDAIILANAFGGSGTPLAKGLILYDSGWLNLTAVTAENYTLFHNLNSTDSTVLVDARELKQGWNRTYGGTSDDFLASAIHSDDDGYALAGSTWSFGAGNDDLWLIKCGTDGNAQWNQTYGGTGNDEASEVIQTSDGGFAVIGTTNSFGAGGEDIWLIKTGADGNIEWNKTYGGTGDDNGTAFTRTKDGGYALAGFTESFSVGANDFWLIKTDVNGTMQWSKTYGGTCNDCARSVIQTSDGGYAVLGEICSFGANLTDLWLVKTDKDGNVEWNKMYGGLGEEIASSVIQTTDGGYAVAGTTRSFGAGGSDFWLVKTDLNGILQWSKTYGGTHDDEVHSVIQSNDGGYALAGSTSNGIGATYPWLVKTDAHGNMEWNKTYGEGNAIAESVVQTGDGAYALGCRTDSIGVGGYDFWLIKTDVESGLAWTDSTPNSVTLLRSLNETRWNFVRVRIWRPKQ